MNTQTLSLLERCYKMIAGFQGDGARGLQDDLEATIEAERSNEQASGEERSAEYWANQLVPPLGYKLVKEQAKPKERLLCVKGVRRFVIA